MRTFNLLVFLLTGPPLQENENENVFGHDLQFKNGDCWRKSFAQNIGTTNSVAAEMVEILKDYQS